MNLLKLVQDTLYWLEQSPSSFVFSEKGFEPQKKAPPIPEKSPALKVENKIPPQKTEIKKEEKKEPPKEEKILEVPPIKPTLTVPNSEITNYFTKYYPSFALVNTPKKDTKAKKIKEAYLYKNQAADVTILCFEKNEKNRLFLQNIAKAIDTYFFPCKVVEKNQEMNWESFLEAKNLKLIIASDYAVWQEASLRTFFREIPAESKRFLKNTPLFLLPEISLYFKDPLLKRSLWKTLCQNLQNL